MTEVGQLECCRPDRARCCTTGHEHSCWESNPPYTIPDCERRNLLSILTWVAAVFAPLPQDAWFLTYGSLLGSIRNGQHISHETDVDIALDMAFWHHAHKLLHNTSHSLSHQTSHSPMAGSFDVDFPDCTDAVTSMNGNQPAARVFLSRTNRVHADIFGYIRERHSNSSIHLKADVYYRIPDDFFYPVSSCHYEGAPYPCPRKASELLQAMYGSNWRVPKPKYVSEAGLKSLHLEQFKQGHRDDDSMRSTFAPVEHKGVMRSARRLCRPLRKATILDPRAAVLRSRHDP